MFTVKMKTRPTSFVLIAGILASGLVLLASAQLCPWDRDARFAGLRSSCQCLVRQDHDQTFSVRCQAVDFAVVNVALQTFAQGSIIESLMVNASLVGTLQDFGFKNLKVINLAITHSGKCVSNAAAAVTVL